MESELREAVLAAAGRADVRQAVLAIYSTLADAIELRRPICSTSGRCCRFEEFGHRLYVSTLELAMFVADMADMQAAGEMKTEPALRDSRKISLPLLSPASATPMHDGAGCRFQMGGLCGVHGARPFGCRVFFCDETSTQWQHDIYEKLHGRLRLLHNQLDVPYFYVEWRFALKVCL